MEPEKTLNSQRNVEKENQSCWHHNPRLQAILQSCSHQDSLVLGAPGWLSQLSVPLDFSSGHDLRVVGLSPMSGSMLGMEPA